MKISGICINFALNDWLQQNIVITFKVFRNKDEPISFSKICNGHTEQNSRKW